MSLTSPEDIGRTSGMLYVALGSTAGPQEVYFSPDGSATGAETIYRNAARWKDVIRERGLLFEQVHVDHYPIEPDELKAMFSCEGQLEEGVVLDLRDHAEAVDRHLSVVPDL